MKQIKITLNRAHNLEQRCNTFAAKEDHKIEDFLAESIRRSDVSAWGDQKNSVVARVQEAAENFKEAEARYLALRESQMILRDAIAEANLRTGITFKMSRIAHLERLQRFYGSHERVLSNKTLQQAEKYVDQRINLYDEMDIKDRLSAIDRDFPTHVVTLTEDQIKSYKENVALIEREILTLKDEIRELNAGVITVKLSSLACEILGV